MAFVIIGSGWYKTRAGNNVRIAPYKGSGTHFWKGIEGDFNYYTNFGSLYADHAAYRPSLNDLVEVISLDEAILAPTNKILLVINKKRSA